MIFDVAPDHLVQRFFGLVNIQRTLVNPLSRISAKPHCSLPGGFPFGLFCHCASAVPSID